MIEKLPELVNGDRLLVHRGRFLSATVLIEATPEAWRLRIEQGRIAAVERQASPMGNWRFALRAPKAEWEEFWKPIPPPGHHDLFALLKRRVLRMEGDLQPLWANMLYFKDVLAKPRQLGRPA
jgi:hypothetical protein